MFNDHIQNTICVTYRLHKNKVESSFIHAKSAETNKKNTHHEFNNPSYTNEESNRAQISQTIKLKQARFLIAESEKELQSLFKAYLDLIGAEGEIVDDGNRAVATFLQNTNEGKVYDAVVVDTHLKGKKGLEVAKKIHERDNSQKIVLVTTSMKEQLPKDELQSASIDEKDILVMPFSLSRLPKMIIH